MTLLAQDKEFTDWLDGVCERYRSLSSDEKSETLDKLIISSTSAQLNYLSQLLPQLLFRDFLILLPIEVTYHILKYLPVSALLSCCAVSRTWSTIVYQSARVWWHKAIECGATDVLYYSSARAVRKYKTLCLQLSQILTGFSRGTTFTQTFLTGHSNRVMAVCHYNGKVATGSDDQSVRVWDAHSGHPLFKVSTHTVCDIKLTARHVYTASFDGTAACWELSTGELRHRFVGHTSAVFSIDINKSGVILTGSSDKSIKIWFAGNNEPDLLASLEDYHSDWITKVHFLKCSEVTKDFVFASVDKNVCHIWCCDKSGRCRKLHSTTRTNGVQITSFSHHKVNLFHLCTWKEKELCNILSAYSYTHDTLTLLYTVPLSGDMPLRCQLLGAGTRFALLTSSSEINQLFVFNFCQNRCVAKIRIPLCRSTRNGATLALGDVRWLDGFDGTLPEGSLITACLQNSCDVLLLNWKQ